MNKIVTPMSKLKDRFKVFEELLRNQNLFDKEVILQEKQPSVNYYTSEQLKGVDADFMKIWYLKNSINKLQYSLAFSFYGIKDDENTLIYLSYKITNEKKEEVTYRKKILSFNDFKNCLISLNKNLKFIIEEVNTDSFLKVTTLIKAVETNFNFNDGNDVIVDLKQKMQKSLEEKLSENIKKFDVLKEENLKKIETFKSVKTIVDRKEKSLKTKYKIEKLEKELNEAKEKMNNEYQIFIEENDFIKIKKEQSDAVFNIKNKFSFINNEFNRNIENLNIDRKIKNTINDELKEKFKDFFSSKFNF